MKLEGLLTVFITVAVILAVIYRVKPLKSLVMGG